MTYVEEIVVFSGTLNTTGLDVFLELFSEVIVLITSNDVPE